MIPEAMLENGGAEAVEQASAWADVLAAGPGLGQSPEALQKPEALLAAAGGKPVVLDGDALNLLVKNQNLEVIRRVAGYLHLIPESWDGFWGRGQKRCWHLPEWQGSWWQRTAA